MTALDCLAAPSIQISPIDYFINIPAKKCGMAPSTKRKADTSAPFRLPPYGGSLNF